MKFAVGDLVTGTIGNRYGYTIRGAICKIIHINYVTGTIKVIIVGFDNSFYEECTLSEKLLLKDVHTQDRLIREAVIFSVKEDRFELYTKECDDSKLIDFLDQM